MTRDGIIQLVERFIRSELMGVGARALPHDVGFVSDGVLDSMACLRLVAFLEETFDMSVQVDQVDAEHLDTLDRIAAMVLSAQDSPGA